MAKLPVPHSITLITTIAASLGLALIFGFIAVRLRLPALLGYLVAGILIGPATPGFVADLELSSQLAEIGVILLMFGVGLHFSFGDLLAVRRIAVPGAVAQISVATALGTAVGVLWGWSLGSGLVFGLALSVASTVVLIKALEQRGLLQSVNGRIAIGWLVVEDLVMVLVLVLLPAVARWTNGGGGLELLIPFATTIGGVAVFVALMVVAGRRLFPWLLWQIAGTGSRELFTLFVVAAALGIAYGAYALFSASFALGAFFAGTVMRESHLSHRAAQETLPLRDAFAVLFFVSVGMLFDPMILANRPLEVVAVVAIIVFGKSLAAFALVLLFRYPLNTALTVSASLAQIGEFSFILVGLARGLGMLPVEGYDLVIAGALISISLNPFVFRAIEPLQTWVRARSKLARALERPDDPLAELPTTVASREVTGHVVVAGYGDVGAEIVRTLADAGVRLVVVEENRDSVERLRAAGVHAVAGNAVDPAVLIQAHIARAAALLITTPDPVGARRMIEIARMLNPDVHTLVRAGDVQQMELLRQDQVGDVFLGKDELAASMARATLASLAALR
ncbi:MAG: YbaL family putative K(+) efflux transporter [Pseudomonadales bacterium]